VAIFSFRAYIARLWQRLLGRRYPKATRDDSKKVK
jgi:hypothetical protein